MATKPRASLTTYNVPAGTPVSRCKGAMIGGTCSAPVYWITEKNGRARIIDCDCEGGRRPSETKDNRQLDLLTGDGAAVYDGVGCDHHATCPDVELFRRQYRD